MTTAASAETDQIILHRVLAKDADLHLSASVSRYRLCHATLDVEHRQYVEAKAAVKSAIAGSQRQLMDLKAALSAACLHRRHVEECEALLALINSCDTRPDTTRAIAALEADIAVLEEEQRRLTAEEERKKRQFSLVMLALDSVQQQWQAEGRKQQQRMEA